MRKLHDHKNGFTMDFLRYVYPSDKRKCPKISFIVYFGSLYDDISKVSILREVDIILNWPIFKNDRKTHLSISIYHNIYIKV